MCLDLKKINGKHPSAPYKAKEDIYTLKIATDVTNHGCRSLYRHCIQNYGNKLKSEIRFTYFSNTSISQGLHSLVSSIRINQYIDYIVGSSGIILCKIPKGSKYYLGVDGDIVSNQLILIEPIIVGNNNTAIKNSVEVKSSWSRTLFKEAVKICDSYGIKIGL